MLSVRMSMGNSTGLWRVRLGGQAWSCEANRAHGSVSFDAWRSGFGQLNWFLLFSESMIVCKFVTERVSLS
jgi:hypothetical protein